VNESRRPSDLRSRRELQVDRRDPHDRADGFEHGCAIATDAEQHAEIEGVPLPAAA